MANTLKIKRSSVEGKIPLVTDLELGELAINTYDGKLFLKRFDGINQYIVTVGGNVGFEVKNQTGSTITKGTLVRFAGTLGASGKLLIAPFLANNEYPSEYVMGVVEDDIVNGGDGFVIDHGKIYNLNTSAFTQGSILYASSTVTGGLTTTLPQAPNNKVTVASVINSSTISGVIEVRITLGSKLNNDELVELTSLANNDVIRYNSANGRFENTSQTNLSVGSATNSTNVVVTDDVSSSATHYIHLGDATSGNDGVKVSSTKITFQPSTGNLTVAGDLNSNSDIRLKSNIQQITNALEKVSSVRGVTFDMEGQRRLGVIAQEIQEIAPEAVNTNSDGYLTVSYGNLVGVLIEAVKELNNEVKLLKEKIESSK